MISALQLPSDGSAGGLPLSRAACLECLVLPGSWAGSPTAASAESSGARAKQSSACTRELAVFHGSADGRVSCAGKYAAEQSGAKVVDPKPYFVGSLQETAKKYPHIGNTIPAVGYSPQQVRAAAGNCLRPSAAELKLM